MISSRERKFTTNATEIAVALKIKKIAKIKKIKSKAKFKLKFKSQIILNVKFVSSKSKKKFALEKNSVRTQQEALNAKNDAIENVENSETKRTEKIVDLNEKNEKKKKKKKQKKKNEISDVEISKLRTTMIKFNRQLNKKIDKSKQKIIFIDFEKKEFSTQFAFRQIKKRVILEVLNNENELRKKMKKKKKINKKLKKRLIEIEYIVH